MTLCIAWIRQEQESKELVFATDSMLTGGGEAWKHGVKLFELPRKDCLLCFAGETAKAYPLVLNLVSSIKFDTKIINQHTDLRQVLDYLCQVFTELINQLQVEITSPDNPRTGARFIFGGWNGGKSFSSSGRFIMAQSKKNFCTKATQVKTPELT